jgi:hypothetical protein
MRSFLNWLLIPALATAIAPHCLSADRSLCPMTKVPDRPFVPPPPYDSMTGSREFLYGTPALWTLVYPDRHIHSGGKLPFFRQGYDWMKERDPRLTVVARRLDGFGRAASGAPAVSAAGKPRFFGHAEPAARPPALAGTSPSLSLSCRTPERLGQQRIDCGTWTGGNVHGNWDRHPGLGLLGDHGPLHPWSG